MRGWAGREEGDRDSNRMKHGLPIHGDERVNEIEGEKVYGI